MPAIIRILFSHVAICQHDSVLSYPAPPGFCSLISCTNRMQNRRNSKYIQYTKTKPDVIRKTCKITSGFYNTLTIFLPNSGCMLQIVLIHIHITLNGSHFSKAAIQIMQPFQQYSLFSNATFSVMQPFQQYIHIFYRMEKFISSAASQSHLGIQNQFLNIRLIHPHRCCHAWSCSLGNILCK